MGGVVVTRGTGEKTVKSSSPSMCHGWKGVPISLGSKSELSEQMEMAC